jgi:hypothetical protein
MLRTDKLIHSASTLAFRPTPEVSLPGNLASPRTGLPPAGCRELFARLGHNHSFVFMAAELLEAPDLSGV